MIRQTESIEYELKYSKCRLLSWRYYHGQYRVYAPEGTPLEEVDEFVRRHRMTMLVTKHFMKRTAEQQWPRQWKGRRTY